MKSLIPFPDLRFASLLLLIGLAYPVVLQADENSGSTTTKTIEQFAPQNWETGRDTRVTANLTAIDRGMGIEIPFSGKGFEYYRMQPVEPIGIPGEAQSVDLTLYMSDPGAGGKFVFEDGHGDWKELNLPRFPAESWETITLEIPKDTVYPIQVQGFVFHNYSTRTKKTDVRIAMEQMTATTDLSRADRETGLYLDWTPKPDAKEEDRTPPATPLFSANFGSTEAGSFFAGTKPELILSMRNWYPAEARVRATLKVTDETGEELFRETQETRFDSTGEIRWSPPVKKYGPYRADLYLERVGAEPENLYQDFAYAPKPHDLSEEEKLSSPYAMNYHAGHGLFLEPFRKAGIVWFRDYAFTWSWLKRAKGRNHNFAGWPGYPGILKTYEEADALVMPVLVRSIPKLEIIDGEFVNNTPPDREWTTHLADVLNGFPQLKYWELDNEYALDPDVKHAEDETGWHHYQEYHKTFGTGVAYLGHGELKAVENGRHGIRPDLVEDAIDNGSFADIDVINFHHYCGVDAPEINVRNYNTGGGGRKAGLFGDKVRDVVKIANKDGKEREVFITEFGWDTLAGQIVTQEQQAAYLARAYMMLASCGVDRSFWYWHFDSPTPSAYFDGCGLMTDRHEPKPSLCAMAGLTHLLPDLDYVGEFNAGPGTQGYVFKQGGQYVAAAWRIQKGDDSIEFDFGPGAELRDIYANPLSGTTATLGITPTYAIGISPKSSAYLQSAYSLDSHHFPSVTAGEESEVLVAVDNNRQEAIEADLTLDLPDGWLSSAPTQSIRVPVQGSTVVPLKFRIPENESTGAEPIEVSITENRTPIETLFVRANVLEPYFVTVGPMPVDQRRATIEVIVENQGNVPQDATVSLSLPDTWKALSEPISIENLRPEEKREVSLALEWDAEIPEGQTAEVRVTSPGVVVSQPIQPPLIRIHRVPGPGWFEGDPSSWPQENRIPDWMIGSSLGLARTEMWLGWTPSGLWGALEVQDSNVRTTDPRSFWKSDVLELFLDTANDKTAKEYGPGDHQYWLVPQPDSNSVFLGQWKRGNEIEETRYDIESIRSKSAATDSGYRMEFLIPWSEIQGSAPRAGTVLGLNLNLTVKGPDGDRQIYWPRVKNSEVMTQPGSWGSIELVE